MIEKIENSLKDLSKKDTILLYLSFLIGIPFVLYSFYLNKAFAQIHTHTQELSRLEQHIQQNKTLLTQDNEQKSALPKGHELISLKSELQSLKEETKLIKNRLSSIASTLEPKKELTLFLEHISQLSDSYTVDLDATPQELPLANGEHFEFYSLLNLDTLSTFSQLLQIFSSMQSSTLFFKVEQCNIYAIDSKSLQCSFKLSIWRVKI